MNTLLIEPTDVLFFRDAIPMTAGQGKGSGCRMPFPSTLHEAFRACLLRAKGGLTKRKRELGRPRTADRSGNWSEHGHDGQTFISTREFSSLRTIGPFPWQPKHGVLLPVPGDAVVDPQSNEILFHQLWRDETVPWVQSLQNPSNYLPPCLPMAVTPPDKKGQLMGWWNLSQMRRYLSGDSANDAGSLLPVPTSDLWLAEDRIGVAIDPATLAAKTGQLFAGSYLRPKKQTRFAIQLQIRDPLAESKGESDAISGLDWLLLGGDFRLARLWHRDSAGKPLPDCFSPLRKAPLPPAGDGPCMLKWVLATPAIFANGSLPGWCADTSKNRREGSLPVGRVCLELPGRAQLVSWSLAKPRAISGWDVVEGRAKPTMLAVPEGGVYYFFCENRATAEALAEKLHWRPRSDFYGEKGCGYGLVSFSVKMHPTSPEVHMLAKELFTC